MGQGAGMEEKCRHNMIKAYCDHCSGNEPPRIKQQVVTARGRIGIYDNLGGDGVVIYPRRRRGELHKSFKLLNSATIKVHIVGILPVFVLPLILEKAPGLKTLQITPRAEHLLKKKQRKLCTNHGVKIVFGHCRPGHAWEDTEEHSPAYRSHKKFFASLTDEQRALFDELLELKFRLALMTARYLCLGGEEYLPQQKVAVLFGMPRPEAASNVCIHVNGVRHYLDPTFKTGGSAKGCAKTIKQQVAVINGYFKNGDERQEFIDALNFLPIPTGLAQEKYPIYWRLRQAEKDGRIRRLKAIDFRLYRVLVLSFGLNGYGKCFTAKKVKSRVRSVGSAEWATALKRKAVEAVGIKWV